MINPRKTPEVCFRCHMDKKMKFRLLYHHPVLEGHMSCADCHSSHGPDVRPWTATSMNDVNEPCFKCHKDKRGPFPWEHGAMREGCTTCHKKVGTSKVNPSLSEISQAYQGKEEQLIKYLKGESEAIVRPEKSGLMKEIYLPTRQELYYRKEDFRNYGRI